MGHLSHALAAVSAVLLSGCADQMLVRVNCVPAGALLAADGTTVGTCPYDLVFPVTSFDKQRGALSIPGISAHWASGAMASVQGTTFLLADGRYHPLQLSRPLGAPGLDVDLDVAADLQRNAILRAEAEAAQRAAFAQEMMVEELRRSRLRAEQDERDRRRNEREERDARGRDRSGAQPPPAPQPSTPPPPRFTPPPVPVSAPPPAPSAKEADDKPKTEAPSDNAPALSR